MRCSEMPSALSKGLALLRRDAVACVHGAGEAEEAAREVR